MSEADIMVGVHRIMTGVVFFLSLTLSSFVACVIFKNEDDGIFIGVIFALITSSIYGVFF